MKDKFADIPGHTPHFLTAEHHSSYNLDIRKTSQILEVDEAICSQCCLN